MTQRNFFDGLPKPILEQVLPVSLDQQSLAALGLVCKNNAQLFAPSLLKEKAKLLVTHVMRGNHTEANQLIEKIPSLLRLIASSEDDECRMMRDTPLGAAVRQKDMKMINIIAHHLHRLPDGEELKKQHIANVYPDGTVPVQQPFDGIESITTIISQYPDTAKMPAEILKKFQEDFTALVKSERHFNPAHLLKAFQIYNSHPVDWNINQIGFFFNKVIGFIQTRLPFCHQQEIYGEYLHYRPDDIFSIGNEVAMSGYKSKSYYTGSHYTELHLELELQPYFDDLTIMLHGIADYCKNDTANLTQRR